MSPTKPAPGSKAIAELEDSETELRRLRAKQEREWAKKAHPFDRQLPQDDAVEVYDDHSEADAVLVAFPGDADRLSIPAVNFFEPLADWKLRRIYIRKLSVLLPQPHRLGNSMTEVADSLQSLISGYRRSVFIGSSFGGFHALLFGTLLGVDAVVGIHPTTSLARSVLAKANDHRWDAALTWTSPAWLGAYGDIADMWERWRGPTTVIHYPYRDRTYAVQAEHLAQQPNVTLVPHYEFAMMHKITEDGSLRQLLANFLWPEASA